MLEKSKTLGILGGGQLGRMSALAAARLGIKTHIYDNASTCPAAQVSQSFTSGSYEDQNKLKEFAAEVDVISYEFENIPIETVNYLKKIKTVYPDSNLLEISQNRLKEKQFLNDIDIPTTRWKAAYSAEDITIALKEWQTSECILKTTRFGYDGKGQLKHTVKDNVLESWKKLNAEEIIIEEIIDFSYEVSTIVARDIYGNVSIYPPAMNEHRDHILWKTIAPAKIPKSLKRNVSDLGKKLAESIDLIGVLALELFVTKDEKLLANEIAPRTHNSGHWTIDACAISQFEQHVRTVCGLPVGNPKPHSEAEMINLIGSEINEIEHYLSMPNASIHLYGKDDAREGRKMGHITVLKTPYTDK